MKHTFILIWLMLGLAGCAAPVDWPDTAAQPVDSAPIFEEPVIVPEPSVFRPGAINEPKVENAVLTGDALLSECSDGGIGGTGCKID